MQRNRGKGRQKIMYNNNDVEKRLAERIFLEELEECEKFPKYIMFENINVCNARCVMCNYVKHMEDKVERQAMSMDLFEHIIEQIYPYADWVEMVTFSGGGEALLDKSLETKIKMLKDIGIKTIQVSTNAAILTKERTRSLLESGLNDLRISIDSIHKDVYEKIRKGLKFEEVIQNAEDAIKIRNEEFPDIPIRIRAVELDENKNERDEWIAFWNKRLSGNDLAQFRPCNMALTGESSDIYLEWPCISPFSTLAVNAIGMVCLCCVDFFDKIMQFGNLNEISIVEIWRGEQFQKVRKLHLEGKRNQISICRNCIMWDET